MNVVQEPCSPYSENGRAHAQFVLFFWPKANVDSSTKFNEALNFLNELAMQDSHCDAWPLFTLHRKTGAMAAAVARTRWLAAFIALSALSLADASAAQVPGPPCPASLARRIPSSPAQALSGSAFAREVETLSGVQRDAVAEPVLLGGNVPEFLRHLRPITLQSPMADGREIKVTVCVTPDYLAVGSNNDFVRVPVGLRTALAVAERFGFLLPTTKIVDAIYAQADIRVAPEPLQASSEMRSTAYFVQHDRLVRQETLAEGAVLGSLIAGQKKDLVITSRLLTYPGRVAIYGWHRQNGLPIQSLSTVHGENYADYSHGVRLVSDVAYVNGKEHPLRAVLQDPQLASAVNSEGPITNLDTLLISLLNGPRSSH